MGKVAGAVMITERGEGAREAAHVAA
ncbi:hypothetical protein E2C01_090210 [Portunus trituberculatus]|uniref:Uncharacterized protein n=1 Tax=Portunus trituberculatus TaxID=210409 RepID=A0A5B7JPJ4_PORTR|nr:hypothetical protein [Portunus trituberculatus]